MKIAILGTGVVGRTLAAKLASLDHNVKIGTRDVAATLAREDKDAFGGPPFKVWRVDHKDIDLVPFAEAAAHGEIAVNALSGRASVDGVKLAGVENLAGKIVMDIANPLDFSKGFPPSLAVCNTDSLGERIQAALPKSKVVKTLNTCNANVMVAPELVAGGDHTMFVCGNDADAKASVAKYLKDWFGWKDVIDIGDITAARGSEMILPIWVRLMGSLNTPMFNFKIAR